jgi:hypothetical protein
MKRRPQRKHPLALVKALNDSDKQSDFINALRAAGILPRLTMRDRHADNELARLDPRCRRFGEF